MKTKNNVQQAAFKSIIAATGLAMLSVTLNAQDSLKSLFENNGTNHMALATKTNDNWLKSNVKTKSLISTNTFATYLSEETEEPLHLEDWMLNEVNFSNLFHIETETEGSLKIEDWMTKESNFDLNSFNFEVETEEELSLEGWMLDENHFNANQMSSFIAQKENNKIISTSTFVYREVNEESTLKIEDWMINSKTWKK